MSNIGLKFLSHRLENLHFSDFHIFSFVVSKLSVHAFGVARRKAAITPPFQLIL